MLFGIVYSIWNKANGKVYIGQTIKTAKRRFIEHIRSANRGDGFHLHRAIKKYGPESFSIEVIASADSQEELNHLERVLIREFRAKNPALGYNMTDGGEFGKLTGEAEVKRLAGLRSPETREKFSRRVGSANHFFGKKHTAEALKIMAIGAAKGGRSWLGRKRTEANRKSLRDRWATMFPLQKASEMYRSGECVDVIAEELGFSRSTIYNRLHSAGIMPPRKKGRKHVTNRNRR